MNTPITWIGEEAVVLSDEDYMAGDLVFDNRENRVEVATDITVSCKHHKVHTKLLYSSNPDRGLPIIDLEQLKKGDDVEKLWQKHIGKNGLTDYQYEEAKRNFISGYNTKERGSYSKLEYANQLLKQVILHLEDGIGNDGIKEMIQQFLSTLQQKPSWVEIEPEEVIDGKVLDVVLKGQVSDFITKQPKLYTRSNGTYINILNFG